MTSKVAAHEFTARVAASVERLDGMNDATARRWLREAKALDLAHDSVSGLVAKLPGGEKRLVVGDEPAETLNSLIRLLS
jgi:hypothetical protein